MNTEERTTAVATAELEALTNEFLRAVSFREGERPSYDKVRALFVDDGKLIKNSSDAPEISTVEQFIAPRQALVDTGELTFFEEVEIAEVTEVFENIAHRLSTYEKRGMTGERRSGRPASSRRSSSEHRTDGG
jgi:hypothetical protein